MSYPIYTFEISNSKYFYRHKLERIYNYKYRYIYIYTSWYPSAALGTRYFEHQILAYCMKKVFNRYSKFNTLNTMLVVSSSVINIIRFQFVGLRFNCLKWQIFFIIFMFFPFHQAHHENNNMLESKLIFLSIFLSILFSLEHFLPSESNK